jgi:hypothetical protein
MRTVECTNVKRDRKPFSCPPHTVGALFICAREHAYTRRRIRRGFCCSLKIAQASSERLRGVPGPEPDPLSALTTRSTQTGKRKRNNHKSRKKPNLGTGTLSDCALDPCWGVLKKKVGSEDKHRQSASYLEPHQQQIKAQ